MIVVFAMPDDRTKANAVVDALVDADLAVWGETSDPGTPAWDESLVKAADARCVVFCWSDTALEDTETAAAYRDAATGLCAKGKTIGVLLAPVTPPPGFACTLYSLAGWRADPAGWRKWLIGDAHMRDVVAAAKSKQANRDPMPPAAPRKLLMRQAAAVFSAVLLPVIGVIGLGDAALNLSNRIAAQPSAAEEAAWAALPAGDCEALRTFVAAYPEGGHRDTADVLIGAARTSETTQWTAATLDDQLYLPHSSTGPGTAPDPDTEAAQRCTMLVQGTGAKLVSAKTEGLRQDCQQVGSEQMCDWRGTVQCAIEEPIIVKQEICAK